MKRYVATIGILAALWTLSSLLSCQPENLRGTVWETEKAIVMVEEGLLVEKKFIFGTTDVTMTWSSLPIDGGTVQTFDSLSPYEQKGKNIIVDMNTLKIYYKISGNTLVLHKGSALGPDGWVDTYPEKGQGETFRLVEPQI